MHDTYPFALEPLNYAYDALEPYIDAQTVTVHFTRYLKSYVDKLNAALEHYPELQFWTLDQLIANCRLLPPAAREAVKNNAGGVYNHYLYFDSMTPPGSSQMKSEFSILLRKEFGSIQRFKELYISATQKLFGSGYVWLVLNADGDLAIVSTSNQDNPLSCGLYPIIALDLWEHAYFVKYLNDKVQYATNWFNLINWDYAYQRYKQFCNSSTDIQ